MKGNMSLHGNSNTFLIIQNRDSQQYARVAFRMEYSRCGLTNAEQRGRIIYLDLLTTILLVQSRTGVAFWAVRVHTASSCPLAIY